MEQEKESRRRRAAGGVLRATYVHKLFHGDALSNVKESARRFLRFALPRAWKSLQPSDYEEFASMASEPAKFAALLSAHEWACLFSLSDLPGLQVRACKYEVLLSSEYLFETKSSTAPKVMPLFAQFYIDFQRDFGLCAKYATAWYLLACSPLLFDKARLSETISLLADIQGLTSLIGKADELAKWFTNSDQVLFGAGSEDKESFREMYSQEWHWIHRFLRIDLPTCAMLVPIPEDQIELYLGGGATRQQKQAPTKPVALPPPPVPERETTTPAPAPPAPEAVTPKVDVSAKKKFAKKSAAASEVVDEEEGEEEGEEEEEEEEEAEAAPAPPATSATAEEIPTIEAIACKYRRSSHSHSQCNEIAAHPYVRSFEERSDLRKRRFTLENVLRLLLVSVFGRHHADHLLAHFFRSPHELSLKARTTPHLMRGDAPQGSSTLNRTKPEHNPEEWHAFLRLYDPLDELPRHGLDLLEVDVLNKLVNQASREQDRVYAPSVKVKRYLTIYAGTNWPRLWVHEWKKLEPQVKEVIILYLNRKPLMPKGTLQLLAYLVPITPQQ